MISSLLASDDPKINNPDIRSEGLLGIHPVTLLSADPVNVSELCGWNAVIVPRWIASDPGYGTRHTVGLNIWGRDDYTVSQVASELLGYFHCSVCEGLGVSFMGPRPAKDNFHLAVFTLTWEE